MHTNISKVCDLPPRRWQFNLATLMFATFVVALCATLVRISPALAVVAFPLVVAALVRTIRARRRSATTAEGQSHTSAGLFRMFWRSVGVVLSLIVISFVAASVTSLAAALVLVDITARVCQPLVASLLVVCAFLYMKARAGWNWLRPQLPELSVKATFDRTRGRAVYSAARLVRANRTLVGRFWYPESTRPVGS